MVASFLFYLTFSLAVLWWFGAQASKNNSRNFWIAPHSAGPYVAAFAAGASDMSSWLFLALPGSVYLWGGQDIFLCLGLILGAYCSWTWVAPMLMVLYDRFPQAQSFIQVLSSGLSPKQKSDVLRKVLTFIIVFFTCIYIAAGISAIAKILNFGFAIDPYLARILGCVLLLAAALLGGALGLNALELVQGTLMLVLLIGLCWCFFDKAQFDTATIATNQSYSVGRIIHDLSWGLGYFGIPHILTRMSVLDKPSEIPKARAVLLTWMVLSLICAFILGFMGRFYFAQLVDHELVIPSFLDELSSQASGVGLALMVGSCLCAGCAQLYSSSSALSEDIFEHKFPRPVAIATIIFLSLSVSMTFDKDVFSLVDLGWAGLTTTFAPYVFIILLGRTLLLETMTVLCTMNFFVVCTLFVFEQISLIGIMLPAFTLHFLLSFYFSSPSTLTSNLEKE